MIYTTINNCCSCWYIIIITNHRCRHIIGCWFTGIMSSPLMQTYCWGFLCEGRGIIQVAATSHCWRCKQGVVLREVFIHIDCWASGGSVDPMCRIIERKPDRVPSLVDLNHVSVTSTTLTQFSAHMSSNSSVSLPKLRGCQFPRKKFGKIFKLTVYLS